MFLFQVVETWLERVGDLEIIFEVIRVALRALKTSLHLLDCGNEAVAFFGEFVLFASRLLALMNLPYTFLMRQNVLRDESQLVVECVAQCSKELALSRIALMAGYANLVE